MTLGAIRSSVTHEAVGVAKTPRSVAVPGAPRSPMAQRCGPAMTPDARTRRVTDATGLRVEVGCGAVGLQSPEPGVGAWRMRPVAVPATGDPVTDRAGIRPDARLGFLPRECGVKTDPPAAVIVGSDSASRPRKAAEAGSRVALSAIRSHVPIVWVTVTVSATGSPNGEGPIEGRNGRLAPLGQRRGERPAALRMMAERACRSPVFSGAPEAGHRVVVELGRTLGRNMAFATVSSEFSPMAIVLQVAIDALVLADLVLPVGMARGAGHGPVFALEREPGVREVPGAGRRKVLQGRVALLTVLSEGALVLVLMAANARELARPVDPARVATAALLLCC